MAIPKDFVDPFDSHPQGFIDPFDPAYKAPAESKIDTAAPLGSEGFAGGVADVGRGLAHGVISGLPEQVGQALQFFGAPETGAKLQQFAKEQDAAHPELRQSVIGQVAQEQSDTGLSVRGGAYSGGENLPASAGPGLAGAAIGGAIGSVFPGPGTIAGAGLGYIAGSLAALPLFYGSQGQQSTEAIRKGLQTKVDAGEMTPEQADAQARSGGHVSGAIEAGGELAGDLIPFGALAKPFAKAVAGQAVKSMFSGSGKRALGTLAKTLLAENVTEMGQQAGEAQVEKEFGSGGPGAEVKDTLSVVVPTTIMSLIPGGFAALHNVRTVSKARELLSDPKADPEDRAAAAALVFQHVKETDPTVAKAFDQYAAAQIAAGQPVVVGDDKLYLEHAQQAAADQAPKAADQAPKAERAGPERSEIPQSLRQQALGGGMPDQPSTAMDVEHIDPIEAAAAPDEMPHTPSTAIGVDEIGTQDIPAPTGPVSNAVAVAGRAGAIAPTIPFTTMQAAQMRASVMTQRSGEPYVATEHPQNPGRFAAVPQRELDHQQALEQQQGASAKAAQKVTADAQKAGDKVRADEQSAAIAAGEAAANPEPVKEGAPPEPKMPAAEVKTHVAALDERIADTQAHVDALKASDNPDDQARIEALTRHTDELKGMQDALKEPPNAPGTQAESTPEVHGKDETQPPRSKDGEGAGGAADQAPEQQARVAPRTTSTGDYYADPGLRELAHGVRKGDEKAIGAAAKRMAPHVPEGATLVPVPGRNGRADATLKLAQAIAAQTGAKVADVLRGNARESLYDLKKRGERPAEGFFGTRLQGEAPANAVLIDNVADTGATLRAARVALPDAHALTLAEVKTAAPAAYTTPQRSYDTERAARAAAEAAGGAEGRPYVVVPHPNLEGKFAIQPDTAHDAATSTTNEKPEPTPPQIEAGNYAKGHIKVGPLRISVENPEGSTRRSQPGVTPAWESKIAKAHYGYIKGTIGADKDHIDAFVKPGTPENHDGPVYVIDQQNAKGFDEHKVMVGYPSKLEAIGAYKANYPKGHKVGPVTETTMKAFDDWARGFETTQPFAETKPAVAETKPAVAETEPGSGETPPGPGETPRAPNALEQRMNAAADAHVAEITDLMDEGISNAELIPMEGERSGDAHAVAMATYEDALKRAGWTAQPGRGHNFTKGEHSLFLSSQGNLAPAIVQWKSGNTEAAAQRAAEAAAKDKAEAARKKNALAEAKAKPTKAKTGFTEVGKNAIGQTLYEDARGVRSYVENGVRASEPVRFVPGSAPSVDVSRRRDQFKTTAEQAPTPTTLTPAQTARRDWNAMDGEARQQAVIQAGLGTPGRRGLFAETEWDKLSANAKARLGPALVSDYRPDVEAKPVTPQVPVRTPTTMGQEAAARGDRRAAPPGLSPAHQRDWLKGYDEAAKTAPSAPEKVPDRFAKNTVFTADKVAEARARLKAKLGRTSAGIDPETLMDGMTIAGAYIEAGIRDFVAFSKAMVDDLGENVRPYLRAFYEAARHYPGLETEGMTSAKDIDAAPLRNEGEGSTIQFTGTENGQQPDHVGGVRGLGEEGAPGAVGPRGNAERPAAGNDAGNVEAQPAGNVGAAGKPGNRGADSGRPASEDVAGGGKQQEGGDALAGRNGASGAGLVDAGPGNGTVQPGGQPAPAKQPGLGNYHIGDPAALVGGGPKARFGKNRAAIEALRATTEESRDATAAERDALAAYTGWGSFGQELFKGNWEHPNPARGWEKEDQWLRDHLGKDEWESAQRSIINAHYTDPPTVQTMWNMVERMGFTGGRVLEPSVGIGNFFGMMPRDVMSRSELTGIELDRLTGGMAKILYPDANIQIKGYQESKTADNFYDLAIGNWPFAKDGPSDRRYNKLNASLHDYFFIKALDQVRPGGLVVGITSNGTMDKIGTVARMAIARKAELVGAFRLPTGAFKEYAGTAVVTDILVFRKRATEKADVAKEGWIETVDYDTPNGKTIRTNEYWLTHKPNILGEMTWGRGTTSGQPGMIVERQSDFEQRLAEIVGRVPEGTYAPAPRAKNIQYVTNNTKDRERSIIDHDGKLMVVQGERLAPLADIVPYAVKSATETAKREAQVRSLIGMRRLYGELIDAERSGDAEKLREKLRKQYQAFTKANGPLNDSVGLSLLNRARDPFYPMLAALEVASGRGKNRTYKPARVLFEATTRGKKALDNPGIKDAFVLARNQSLDVDPEAIARLSNTTAEAVIAELTANNAIFHTPTGTYEVADVYLSGNVRRKLREAEEAAAAGADMARNLEALKKVIPKDVPYFKIEAKLGAPWVPAKQYEAFVHELLGLTDSEKAAVHVENRLGSWRVEIENERILRKPEATTVHGVTFYPFHKLLRAAMNNLAVTIRVRDEDGNMVVDAPMSAEANAKVAALRERFPEWLWSDMDRRITSEREYNESMNAIADVQFDGSFLDMAGMTLRRGNDAFALRSHQVNAIWRGLVNRLGIYAHEVGTGKTYTMGGLAVESRRYGIAKKPLLFAHNANSASVAREIGEMYPGAKLLYIDNLDPGRIDITMRQIANDDWDAIVVPHSLIDRFALKPETLRALAAEEIATLEEEAIEAAQADGVNLDVGDMDDEDAMKHVRSSTAKELVKARNAILKKIDDAAIRASKEDAVPFEDLGVDMLIVDEAHEFKKPPLATRMSLKGLNKGTSDKSISLRFLTDYVKGQNGGTGVHLFTGTPITNTLNEIYNLQRYVADNQMARDGIKDWDSWFNTFADSVTDVELTAAATYEPVTRLASFVNTAELRRMIGGYTDIVFADDMPEFRPRTTANGKNLRSENLTPQEKNELLNGRSVNPVGRPYKQIINDVAPMSPGQKIILERLVQLATQFKNATKKARREMMLSGHPASPVIVETAAAAAGLDPRLYDKNAPDDPNLKINRATKNVLKHYREHPQSTQVIFVERGYNATADRSVRSGHAVVRGSDGKSIKERVDVFPFVASLVDKLVAEGIPREQIAVVNGSVSKEKRKEISDRMNTAEIRVVIGLSTTLGTGVNMQDNLRAMHHLDAPWMPGLLEQRNGRGWRQGNQWNTVMEYRYITDRVDGRRWQVLAVKDRFIKAFLTADENVRVIEGDAASMDEEDDIVASLSEAAGDPRILLLQKYKQDVERLQNKQRYHDYARDDAKQRLKLAREQIDTLERRNARLAADVAFLDAERAKPFTATIEGKTFDNRKDTDAAIAAWVGKLTQPNGVFKQIGEIHGFSISARWPHRDAELQFKLTRGASDYFAQASVASMEAMLRGSHKLLTDGQTQLASLKNSVPRLEEAMAAPFPRAADLEKKVTLLHQIESDLAANPVPAPIWLRQGAPIKTTIFARGREYEVEGHQWAKDGFYVLVNTAEGVRRVPYMDAKSDTGVPMYQPHPFAPPVTAVGHIGIGTILVRKSDGATFKAKSAPRDQDGVSLITAENTVNGEVSEQRLDGLEPQKMPEPATIPLLEGVARQAPLNVVEGPEPPFYSALARSIDAKAPFAKDGTIQPGQLRMWLAARAKDGTFKPDELTWSGLDEWLQTQTGKVTKAQVQAFLDQNGVRVTEKVLGGSGAREANQPALIAEYQRWRETHDLPNESADELMHRDGLTDAQRAWLHGFSARWDADAAGESQADALRVALDSLGYDVQIDPEGYLSEVTSRKTMRSYFYSTDHDDFVGEDVHGRAVRLPATVAPIVDQLRQATNTVMGEDDAEGRTQYSSYTLPGGDNYRELLLTLPEKPVAPQPSATVADLRAAGWTVTQKEHNRYTGQMNYVIRDADGDMVVQRSSGAPGDLSDDDALAAYLASDIASQQRVSARAATFRSSHFDTPNILAHVRFDDRTDADGKKVLFVEEFQSDWAQKGRREGFKQPETVQKARQAVLDATQDFDRAVRTLRRTGLWWDGDKTAWAVQNEQGQRAVPVKLVELWRDPSTNLAAWASVSPDGSAPRGLHASYTGETEADAWRQMYSGSNSVPMTEEQWGAWKGLQEASRAASAAESEQYNARNRGVPNAPFVGKTEAWLALALKRMIRYAAEHGYDRIAWTNGEQQAERYDLSKHVSKVSYTKREAGYDVFAYAANTGKVAWHEDHITLARVEEVLGKEISRKIESSEGAIDPKSKSDTWRDLTGLDLKVGGEGMRSFYDKIVPNVANDVLKKLGGGKVGAVDITGTSEKPGTYSETRVYREDGAWHAEGFDSGEWQYLGDFPTKRDAEQAIGSAPMPQPGFDITPAMRGAALRGQPLFARQLDFGTVERVPVQPRATSIEATVGGEPPLILKHLEDVRALSPREETAIAGAMREALALGMPKVVMDNLSPIGAHPAQRPGTNEANGHATYWIEEAAVSVHAGVLDNLVRGVGDWNSVIPGLLIHEFGHRIDMGVDGKAASAGSPLFTIGRIGERRVPRGPLMVEAMNAFVRGDPELQSLLRYPLAYWEDKAQSDALLQSEVFAQLWRAYHTNPALLAKAMPRTVAVMKELHNDLQQLERLDDARQAVRRALRADPQGRIDLAAANRDDSGARPRSFAVREPGQGLGWTGDGRAAAENYLSDFLNSPRQLNPILKEFQTQYHKAETNPYFKPVFQSAQAYLRDVSRFATDAADLAPTLLPRLGNLRDVLPAFLGGTAAPKREDVAAVGKAVFAATLGDIRPTDTELRAGLTVPVTYGDTIGAVDIPALTEPQLQLYHQSRAALDLTLDQTATSEAVKMGAGEGLDDVLKAAKEAPTTGAQRIADALWDQANALERVGSLSEGIRKRSLSKQVQEIGDKAAELKAKGYAPLMRFGKFTVNVTEMDAGRPKEIFFGMFESVREMNQRARQLRELYPDATVTTGTMNDEKWKLFQGLSLDSLAAFAEATGAAQGPMFQDFYKLALSSRSALKRLIHRKGIEGYDEDLQRVLASFVTSQARLASRNYHFGEMVSAANAIPAQYGDVGKEATKLVAYVQNPVEEASAVRGLLFINFLGGSVASALVNLTQVVMMTTPYLSRFSNPAVAMKEVVHGGLVAVGKEVADPELQAALSRAAREGITEPQELHQLYAESIRGLGRNFIVRKGLRAWGSLFALAESFNRRTTFVAAYRIAQTLSQEQLAAAGVANAFDFAEKAVEDTQGLYNRGNRPNLARGALGATVFTFKQFSIAYLEFFSRLPRREKLLAGALLIAGAGIQGAPGAEDLEDLIDTIGQLLGFNTNSKESLRRWAANYLGGFGSFLTHGVSGIPGVPIDVSQRLGFSNLIPGTAVFKRSETDKTKDVFEFMGPLGGVYQQLAQGFTALESGNPGGALQAAAPTAIQNAMKGLDMWTTGQYRDSRNRKVMDVTKGDAALKAIGIQPRDVALDSTQAQEVRQDLAMRNSVEAGVADRWARGILNKEPEQVTQAVRELHDWNQRNPDWPIVLTIAQIKLRVMQAMLERDTRMVKGAPKEARGMVLQQLRE